MGNILELINKEFAIADYIIQENNSEYMFKHHTNSDFWIVETSDFDLDNQEEFFNKCVKGKFLEAEKNTSLLIIQSKIKLSENDKEWIIEVENDPYYFKKYVLAYSNDAWEKLNEILNHLEYTSISELLMKQEYFDNLKSEVEEYGPYSLLYNIAHKLPFIMMNVNSTEYVGEDSINCSDPDMKSLFDWVNSFPDEKQELDSKIKHFFEDGEK